MNQVTANALRHDRSDIGPKKDRTSLLEQAEAGMHVYLLSRVNNYIFGRGLEIDCIFVALTVASVGMDQALRTERDPGVS